MATKLIIVWIAILAAITGRAQVNLDQEWLIGYRGYQVKFTGASIIHDTSLFPITNGYFAHGHSNICDSNGHLVLATDGMKILDSLGNYIEDGDSLASPDFYTFSSSYTGYPQTSIFLPMEDNKYYLVTPTANDTMLNNQWLTWLNGNFNVLNYHVIDMNANAGAGKVIQRMQPLLENRFMDKTLMSACRHANGKDWWLLKRSGIMGGDSNFFYTFLFTQDSVYNYGIQLIPFPRNENYVWDRFGQLKFNEEGTQIAWTISDSLGELHTADFDRCTGMLSNYKKINIPDTDKLPVGLSYSTNGRFIYVSFNRYILQYDQQDTNIQTAWYFVYGMDTTADQFNGYTSLQLAPNGSIYIGHYHGFSKEMSSIDQPDVKGSGCNFCRKCLRSQSTFGYLITPP